MKNTPSFVFLLLFAYVPVSAQAAETTTLFQLDANQFPLGEVTSEALKETRATGNVPIAFQLRTKDPNPTLMNVELSKGVKALRIKAPDVLANVPPAPIALYFDEKSLGEQIDSNRPLHLEIKFQRRGTPIHFSTTAIFRAENTGPIIPAALGVLFSTGTYRAMKTPLTSSGGVKQSLELPSDEIATLKYELAQEPDRLTVKTSLVAGELDLFETDLEPATITGCKLSELNGLTLMVAHYVEDSGDDSIDLISIKAWQ